MGAKDLVGFLSQIITSWQIIFITVALIIYFSLVSYVAKTHHPRRQSGFSVKPPAKKGKSKKAAEEIPSGSDDDDLGLE